MHAIRRRHLVAGVVLLAGPSDAEEPRPIVLAVAVDVSCPGTDALVPALVGRGFQVVADTGGALVLDVESAGDSVRVALQDEAGAHLLDRTIHETDCAALADAIVLLVESRVRGVETEVAVPVPEPEPPPRAPPPTRSRPVERGAPASLEARAGAALASAFEDRGAPLGPEVAVRLRVARWVRGGLSVGWHRQSWAVVDSASVQVDRIPVGLEAGAGVGAGRWSVDLSARLEIEAFSARARGLWVSRSQTRAALRAGPILGVGFEPVRGLDLRLDAGALFLLGGYDLEITGLGVVGRQSTLALRAGASLGWRFEM